MFKNYLLIKISNLIAIFFIIILINTNDNITINILKDYNFYQYSLLLIFSYLLYFSISYNLINFFIKSCLST